jgi:hypothetical protein
MALAHDETLLRQRGYHVTEVDRLEPVSAAGVMTGRRKALLSGRRQRGDAVVEVQLQSVGLGRGSSKAGVAQVKRSSVTGDGLPLPRGWWGLLKQFSSGPYIAVAVLAVFMCSGDWVIMLPGVLLFAALARSARSSSGLKRWSDLVASSAASRFAVCGMDRDAARIALGPAMRDALMKAQGFGLCAVKPGSITLDRPIGYGRYDVFRNVLDSLDAPESSGP